MSATLSANPQSKSAPDTQPRALSSSSLLLCACAVLLLAPLAFAAVEPWSIFALETSAALLLGAWALRQVRSGELKITRHPLHLPMLAFLLLGFFQYVTGRTAYRHATYSLLLLYLAYGILTFVVTQTLRRSSQLRLLAWIVCAYGAVVACFAFLQAIAPNGRLYWIWAPQQGGLIFGPYVNHNHYAGLMEMLAPFPIVLALSAFGHRRRKLALTGIGVLMAGTIFLSGSRGGMVAFLVQVLVLAILLWSRHDDWKRPALLGLALLAGIALFVWIGGNEVTRRLTSIHAEARHELNGGMRLSIVRDSFPMWRSRPVLGWGLGTFPVVYPRFRSFYTNFFVNQAHNDYVQLLVETGLAGFGIAVWFLVLTFRGARAKLQNWTETVNGTLTVAALTGVVGILVHSFFDFNLEIPANAAIFYVLCALASSEKVQESQRQRRRSRRQSLILEPSVDRT